MSTGVPAVRVSAARDMMAFVDKFEPGAAAKARALFPKEALDTFDSMPRTSWLEIDIDHFVVDGVCTVLGRERAIRCWRDSVPDIVDKPLLRTFVSGMLRVFGRDPSRIVALIPKAWPLIYRNFCTVRLESEGHGHARLSFEDVTPSLRQYPNYFHSWNGVCQGFSHLAKVNGRVDFEVAKNLGSAVATFSW